MPSLFEPDYPQPRSLFAAPTPIDDPAVAREFETNPFLSGANALVQLANRGLVAPLLSAAQQYQNGDIESAARTLSLFGLPLRGAPRGLFGDALGDAEAATAAKGIDAAPAYVPSPSGSIDWGAISQEAADASGGKLKALPIRVMNGNPGFGLDHIPPARLQRIKDMGFSGPQEFINYVAKNHNLILEQPNQPGARTAIVVSPGRGMISSAKPANNFMAIDLRREGDHYGVTTVIPDARDSYLSSDGKSVLWRRPDQ